MVVLLRCGFVDSRYLGFGFVDLRVYCLLVGWGDLLCLVIGAVFYCVVGLPADCLWFYWLFVVMRWFCFVVWFACYGLGNSWLCTFVFACLCFWLVVVFAR